MKTLRLTGEFGKPIKIYPDLIFSMQSVSPDITPLDQRFLPKLEKDLRQAAKEEGRKICSFEHRPKSVGIEVGISEFFNLYTSRHFLSLSGVSYPRLTLITAALPKQKIVTEVDQGDGTFITQEDLVSIHCRVFETAGEIKAAIKSGIDDLHDKTVEKYDHMQEAGYQPTLQRMIKELFPAKKSRPISGQIALSNP